MKRNIKYQLRLFITAAFCIWAVVLSFGWMQYKAEKDARRKMMSARVSLLVANIFDMKTTGEPLDQYLKTIGEIFDDSEFTGITITVHDAKTGRMLSHTGKKIPYIPSATQFKDADVVKYPNGSVLYRMNNFTPPGVDEKIVYYATQISPDGKLEVRSLIPSSPALHKSLQIKPIFWLIILGIGISGTVLAFFVTKHQAKNVALLHDFARRAASDRDFIPMGDFPSDEIGDISRQIVAIYNSRMQSNVRREREHVIALKATKEKNAMKRALTNNISHELKTPIGIIRGYVDMMISEPDMPAEDRIHFLQKTQQNVERIVTMLADLSTMTRLEEGARNIQLKPINFHDFIFTVEEDLRTGALLGDMEFKFDIPMDCEVMGNEGLLTSTITNLAKNARAYSQGTEMGVKLMGTNDNYYTFSFYDNGVGVGEEHLQYLFDRFYRIDVGRSRKSGGTGLGLPIAKSSINSMGGSMTVRNRRGGGLEFIFTLQRVRKNNNPASQDAGESQL